MILELTWAIGKEDKSLDAPPYRAYFYWHKDGTLQNAMDFSKEELEIEIQRKRLQGEDTTEFESALKRLQ